MQIIVNKKLTESVEFMYNKVLPYGFNSQVWSMGGHVVTGLEHGGWTLAATSDNGTFR